MSGSNAINIQLDSCNKIALNHTFGQLTNTNASSQINSQYCKGDIGTSGITLYDASTYAGRWTNSQVNISNSGASTTRSVIGGSFSYAINCSFAFPITTNCTQFNLERSDHSTYGLNVTPLTVNGGVVPIFNSSLSGGNAPSLTINSPGGVILDLITLNTASGNVISGNGYLNFTSIFALDPSLIDGSIVYVGGSPSYINTLFLKNALGHASGGTDITSPGASGNVLTSNGTNWTSAPASGSIISGTFLPHINGDTVQDTITYNSQSGYYQKIGNIATVVIQASWSSIGAASRTLQITNLPFMSTANGSAPAMAVNFDSNPLTSYPGVQPYVEVVTSSILADVIYFNPTVGSTGGLAIVANNSLSVCLIYETT